MIFQELQIKSNLRMIFEERVFEDRISVNYGICHSLSKNGVKN